jgi:prepilin-type N-terminal cleavage/methylation domain-containing protein
MLPSQGFTLIEILISLLLISCMLLGLDAMQVASLRAAKSAYYTSIAAQQFQVMQHQLQVITSQDYQSLYQQWNSQNQAVLPNGHGSIKGSYPSFELTLSWGKANTESCEDKSQGMTECLSQTITL